MYNFIDTNEVSESVTLPSEALQINGEYIEHLIDGYRTLNVSGREALSPELDIFETGVRDGSVRRYKRYPARLIVVRYQLTAKTSEAFREAFNALGGILDVEDAELIFNDEKDKYFTGTPCGIGEVEAGRNSVVGEFEILCEDPFKYSVVEYEAESFMQDGSILIDYNGTYKSYPTLQADFFKESDVNEDGTAGSLTGNGDCGYVAFFNENEKIIQLGNPDEKDTETAFEKSQTLINQIFSNWSDAAKAPWAVNVGNVLPSGIVQGGAVGMGVASYEVPANPATTSGTLLQKPTTQGAPIFNYTVKAKTSGRTANSVKVDIAITASLKYDTSYFGRGYGLKASVYIGGAWRDVTLKKTTDYWRGRTGHTVNLSVVVSGLSASTNALTGIKFKTARTDSLGQTTGVMPETACANLSISTFVASVPETYFLTATDYGTAAGKWHGAAITRTLKADASGIVGASDFTFTYKQKMCVNKVTQLGGFHAHLSTADGTNVAGVRINKSASGNNANLILYLNGKEVHKQLIDLSLNNPFFGASNAVQTSSITKTGASVAFNIAGIKKTFVDDALKDVKAVKVTFLFEQYSTVEKLAFNGLYWVKFIKNNCTTWKDIPNKFSANDTALADCKDGKIYLNGVESPEYGALGNDWEEFYLTKGLNQIGVSFSDWVTPEYAPKFKVRYREVFL